MDKFNSVFNDKLECMYTNQYLLGFVVLCTIIYCIIIRARAPRIIDRLLRNRLFIFSALSFILYKVNHDAKISVLLTFGFMIVMSLGKNKNEYFTSTADNSSETKVEKKIDNKTDNMDSAAECYESDNDHNTEYCNLSKNNMKTAQCNYCPDKKPVVDNKLLV